VTSEPDWLALDREDLTAVATAYRRETRGRKQWAWVGVGLGGLALGPTLITIGERLGWPSALAPVFFGGGWAALIGSTIMVWRNERRARANLQLHCPECDAPLIDGRMSRGGLTSADAVVASGHCPSCGCRLLPGDR
jgi:hypothetical protein